VCFFFLFLFFSTGTSVSLYKHINQCIEKSLYPYNRITLRTIRTTAMKTQFCADSEGLKSTLCHNRFGSPEYVNTHDFCSGWGPISSHGRADFTPCFVDATVDIVSIGFILLGTIELYFLSRLRSYPVPKDWHYVLKLVLP
jgi:hypothetical protein